MISRAQPSEAYALIECHYWHQAQLKPSITNLLTSQSSSVAILLQAQKHCPLLSSLSCLSIIPGRLLMNKPALLLSLRRYAATVLFSPVQLLSSAWLCSLCS